MLRLFIASMPACCLGKYLSIAKQYKKRQAQKFFDAVTAVVTRGSNKPIAAMPALRIRKPLEKGNTP